MYVGITKFEREGSFFYNRWEKIIKKCEKNNEYVLCICSCSSIHVRTYKCVILSLILMIKISNWFEYELQKYINHSTVNVLRHWKFRSDYLARSIFFLTFIDRTNKNYNMNWMHGKYLSEPLSRKSMLL